jgi:hypothetical protein
VEIYFRGQPAGEAKICDHENNGHHFRSENYDQD